MRNVQPELAETQMLAMLLSPHALALRRAPHLCEELACETEP